MDINYYIMIVDLRISNDFCIVKSIDFMRFLYMSGLTKRRICGILREHVINLLPVYILNIDH